MIPIVVREVEVPGEKCGGDQTLVIGGGRSVGLEIKIRSPSRSTTLDSIVDRTSQKPYIETR